MPASHLAQGEEGLVDWLRLFRMPLPRLNNTKYGTVTVGLTAVPVPTNAFAPKEVFTLQNMSAGKVYWGSDNLVTVLTGFPVTPSIAVDYGGPIFLVSDTTAQDVRYCILY